jgi:hypothetical protein
VTADGDQIGGTVSDDDPNYYFGQSEGEGLTPGFWKNNVEEWDAVAWPRTSDGTLIYSPDDTLSSVFDGLDAYGLADTTLVEALDLNGGGVSALMRHAVAALLNATHSAVAYPMTSSEVVSATNQVLASGSKKEITDLKTLFDTYNNYDADLDQHGDTSGSAAIRAEGGEASTQTAGVSISADDLQASLVAALAQWNLTDVDGLSVVVADLSGDLLALTIGNTIIIDRDAAGYGWFVDPTPYDAEEFVVSADGSDLIASADSGAASAMDLQTVLMHELGHIVGLQHSDGDSESVMLETLDVGVRRLVEPVEQMTISSSQLTPDSPILLFDDTAIRIERKDDYENSDPGNGGMIFIEQIGGFVRLDDLEKLGVWGNLDAGNLLTDDGDSFLDASTLDNDHGRKDHREPVIDWGRGKSSSW